MNEPLTVGSLFSGIEGIGLGLERAGMRVSWQCEKDDAARRVLARHWPAVHCYDDVTTLKGPDVPRVDVLCGGFPCQDLSVAGRRAGLAGERSGLFHEFMRIADELAPRWVLVENVPGLLSSNDGADMGVVLDALADLGYGWCYRVLDAQYFGVAQRRRRVFIVGCAGDPRRAAQVLLEPSCCDGNSPPRREARKVVAALTADGVGTCGADDNQGQAGHLIPVGFDWRAGGGETCSGAFARDMAPTMNTRDDLAVSYPSWQGPLQQDQQDQIVSPDDVSPTLAHASNTHSGHHEPMVMAYNPYRTLEKDGSITSGFAARPAVDALHGPTGNKEPLIADAMAVRRLMPIECERLQGFPDGWTDAETDSARYRLLGNAVCVPVAAWIGRRIVEAVAS